MQFIKTVFKNIHTLHFKIFKVFICKDFTGETNMGFASSPAYIKNACRTGAYLTCLDQEDRFELCCL